MLTIFNTQKWEDYCRENGYEYLGVYMDPKTSDILGHFAQKEDETILLGGKQRAVNRQIYNFPAKSCISPEHLMKKAKKIDITEYPILIGFSEWGSDMHETDDPYLFAFKPESKEEIVKYVDYWTGKGSWLSFGYVEVAVPKDLEAQAKKDIIEYLKQNENAKIYLNRLITGTYL